MSDPSAGNLDALLLAERQAERDRIVAVIRGLGWPHGGHFERPGYDRFEIARSIHCPMCGERRGVACGRDGQMCMERMPHGPAQWLHPLNADLFVEDVIAAILAGQEGT